MKPGSFATDNGVSWREKITIIALRLMKGETGSLMPLTLCSASVGGAVLPGGCGLGAGAAEGGSGGAEGGVPHATEGQR